MNTLPRGAHSMRIVALPLARVKVSRDTNAKLNSGPILNANTMLVFYHFDLIAQRGGGESLPWHRKALKNITNKVLNLWTSLGKAPKGSWKLWTYDLGERIADRIEFEELALRSIDLSSRPAVPLTGTTRRGNGSSENRSHNLHSHPKIPLIYPPSLYSAHQMAGDSYTLCPPLAHLRALVTSRGPRHRRGFYLWMFIAPLTTPIALIPLIPNLPLFFCVWRSWSHYRAYRSSRYLSSLLDRGLIEPNPSPELDGLYSSSTSTTKISQIPHTEPGTAPGTGTSQSEGILLTRLEAMPYILKMFRLPESTMVNIYRAMDQARGRIGTSSLHDSS